MSKSLGFSNIYNSSFNNYKGSPYDNLINETYNNGVNNSDTLYAQKLPSNTLSNVVNYNQNYISDEDLYKKMWHNINEYENVIPYPYLDTEGNITVGGGTNINNYNDFMKVNFLKGNNSADNIQKNIGFNQLHDMSKHKDSNGNYLYANTRANFFEPITDLRITDYEAYRLAQNHMTNDLAHVRREFTDFDRFPNPLKEVLLDIQYNTGGLNKQNWPKLYEAIANRNVNGIVDNVHRKDVGPDRNDWAKRMSRSIKF